MQAFFKLSPAFLYGYRETASGGKNPPEGVSFCSFLQYILLFSGRHCLSHFFHNESIT